MTPDSPPLQIAFEQQDEVFASAFLILQKAIASRAFPAASVAVTYRGKLVALKALGHFTYEALSENEAGARSFPSSAKGVASTFLSEGVARTFRSEEPGQGVVDTSTLFDLASLTKVVATTTTAMILYERGLLDLETPISAIVHEFMNDAAKDPLRHEVTLRMLLAHSSGLPAYEKLFLKAHTRDQLLQAAFTTPLVADPNTRAVYSDIGFIILGIALERLADESLDRFCQREIFSPLAMTSTTFNPPSELHRKIPPTADEREELRATAVPVRPETCGSATPVRAETCGSDIPVRGMPAPKQPSGGSQQTTRSMFRKRLIQGEVQDENASILGGIAPHAGLFSTPEDLAKFAHAMLNGGVPILRPETVSLLTRREVTPPGTSRALGWDTPSGRSQSGKYLSPNSYGHLGYTGTSLWIDPARQLSITLLTNRTWPDCLNQAIQQIRPKFHDAIIEALGSQS